MRIARDIELRLERLIDGLSARVFRGRMHPVDLANRLVRYVDLSVSKGPAGPYIANRYVVRVNPTDLDPGIDVDALESELGVAVASLAREHGWRLGGPVSVAVTSDDSVATGAIRCDVSSAPGPMEPWAQLLDPKSAAIHAIGDNRNLIGRGEDADIRLDHAKVSRSHALLHRMGSEVWLRDLHSANGTSINGSPIHPNQDTRILTGDTLAFGPATFSFRSL